VPIMRPRPGSGASIGFAGCRQPGSFGKVDESVPVVVESVVALMGRALLRRVQSDDASRVARKVDELVPVVVEAVVAGVEGRALARVRGARAAEVLGMVDEPVAIVVEPVAAVRLVDDREQRVAIGVEIDDQADVAEERRVRRLADVAAPGEEDPDEAGRIAAAGERAAAGIADDDVGLVLPVRGVREVVEADLDGLGVECEDADGADPVGAPAHRARARPAPAVDAHPGRRRSPIEAVADHGQERVHARRTVGQGHVRDRRTRRELERDQVRPGRIRVAEPHRRVGHRRIGRSAQPEGARPDVIRGQDPAVSEVDAGQPVDDAHATESGIGRRRGRVLRPGPRRDQGGPRRRRRRRCGDRQGSAGDQPCGGAQREA
jgi:hypothetical protein